MTELGPTIGVSSEARQFRTSPDRYSTLPSSLSELVLPFRHCLVAGLESFQFIPSIQDGYGREAFTVCVPVRCWCSSRSLWGQYTLSFHNYLADRPNVDFNHVCHALCYMSTWLIAISGIRWMLSRPGCMFTAPMRIDLFAYNMQATAKQAYCGRRCIHWHGWLLSQDHQERGFLKAIPRYKRTDFDGSAQEVWPMSQWMNTR